MSQWLTNGEQDFIRGDPMDLLGGVLARLRPLRRAHLAFNGDATMNWPYWTAGAGAGDRHGGAATVSLAPTPFLLPAVPPLRKHGFIALHRGVAAA